MTVLIDSEYANTYTPGLAELDDCSSKKVLWLELSVNTEFSLAVVAIACPRLLADSADCMDLAAECRLPSRTTKNTHDLVSIPRY